MQNLKKQLNRNILYDKLITTVLYTVSFMSLLFVIWLLYTVVFKHITDVRPEFITGIPEELSEGGGIGPFLFNSFYVTILSIIIALPVSLGAGIYMAEYAKDGKFTNFISTGIEALASVPSIVLGLFGLSLFVGYFGIGLTILGSAVTLALLGMPVLTKVIEDALRSVPKELRTSALALGATKFEAISKIVLPVALSRIFTGISLVTGRAFGESAVILLVGGTSASDKLFNFDLFAPGATLAVHLWYVQSEAIVPDAHEIAMKSSAVLVCSVLLINIVLRIPGVVLNYKNRK